MLIMTKSGRGGCVDKFGGLCRRKRGPDGLTSLLYVIGGLGTTANPECSKKSRLNPSSKGLPELPHCLPLPLGNGSTAAGASTGQPISCWLSRAWVRIASMAKDKTQRRAARTTA
jgi:hypothetical protein